MVKAKTIKFVEEHKPSSGGIFFVNLCLFYPKPIKNIKTLCINKTKADDVFRDLSETKNFESVAK